MIISFEHRFIFLKSRKTAGTSIEIALSGICGDEDVICPISTRDEQARKKIIGRTRQNYSIPFKNYSTKEKITLLLLGKRLEFYNHIPASELSKRISPHIWDGFFTFCFDRNPWDKVISHYFHLNRKGRFNDISEYLDTNLWEILHCHKMYCEDGKPIVDKIYKYEEMGKSLEDISERMRFPTPLKLTDYKAKSEFRIDKRHYREILTQVQAEIIAERFAKDIELMGYSY